MCFFTKFSSGNLPPGEKRREGVRNGAGGGPYTARTVDALAAAAIARGEVTALEHKIRDHAVEEGALVVQRLATLADTLLARAKGAEVLARLGRRVRVQVEDDAPGGRAVNLDVEEHLLVRHLEGSGQGRNERNFL